MGCAAIVSAIVMLFFSLAGQADAAHGVSIDGNLKYSAGFSAFAYTSPDARKGGAWVLHSVGSFDKMNPFTLKGEAPLGLEMLVFETLAVPSLDEPFTEYGLIASDIEIPEDRMSVIYTIDERARFSDGTPLTVQDVAFSVATLKSDDVHPFYPYYYKDIFETEILDEHRIRFIFAKKNRELPMIASQIPVFSRTSFSGTASDSGGQLLVPIGSGPYLVSAYKQGKYITYKRNEHYWAADHPTRKNMYNYDTITINYYKDQTVALEALKAGDFDFMSINIAKQWARDLSGPKFDSGELVKKLYPHSLNAGMQGFLMNTRKPFFADVRVRQALGLAVYLEGTNKTLFSGQYTRNDSFFSNSPYAATGLPEGLELDYLEPYRETLPAEVFTVPLQPVTTEGRGGLRANLRAAKALLAEAGWTVVDGVLKNDKGHAFAFEILLVSPTFERVMASYAANLEKLGMRVQYRTIDPTLYTERVKNFDFDMIVTSYGQSLSPGNEQRNFWHSSAADTPGSRNYAGIKSVAVDGLIERIIYAENSSELTAACKALDRVLWYGYYLVPNWYMSGHRLVYHNKFRQPQTLPEYYGEMQLLMTWWLMDSR